MLNHPSNLKPPVPALSVARLDLQRCRREAWLVYQENFWTLVGAAIASVAISIGSCGVMLGYFCGGWAALCLNALTRPDHKVDAAMLYSQAHRFNRLFIIAAVGVSIELLGLAAGILPGIFCIGFWLLSFPLAIDRNLSAKAAMNASSEVVQRRGFKLNFSLAIDVAFLNFLPFYSAAVLSALGFSWKLSLVLTLIGLLLWPLGWLELTAAYIQEVRERQEDVPEGTTEPDRGFEVQIVSRSAPPQTDNTKIERQVRDAPISRQ